MKNQHYEPLWQHCFMQSLCRYIYASVSVPFAQTLVLRGVWSGPVGEDIWVSRPPQRTGLSWPPPSSKTWIFWVIPGSWVFWVNPVWWVAPGTVLIYVNLTSPEWLACHLKRSGQRISHSSAITSAPRSLGPSQIMSRRSATKEKTCLRWDADHCNTTKSRLGSWLRPAEFTSHDKGVTLKYWLWKYYCDLDHWFRLSLETKCTVQISNIKSVD